MKTFGFTLIVAGLVLVVASVATAQGQTAFTLVGKDDQKWYLEGQSQANPTIEVAPNTQITITIQQEGDIPHNIYVDDASTATDPTTADGETLQYTFTSKASGTMKYVCQLHGTPMSGTLRVFGTTDGDGGEKESPGAATLGAILALAGAALLVGRRFR